MGKYRMNMGKEDIMGEGTSSICRKGVNIVTGEAVAIKVYKSSSKNGSRYEDVKLKKFARQISVLQQLQEPFEEPDDPTMWHDELANAKPSRLFMQLIDYSKNDKGEPGPDPEDGILYVVTELGQYSLKDYLTFRRDQQRPLPHELVRRITKAIIHVMAGLHAKKLVHIDLKPENLMMFNGRLKLIDVDGCMRSGTLVSIQDSSISFSPCYCAPEWAKFLIEESDSSVSKIQVLPSLDVWSVGMTICELVTLDAILKPMYAKFLRQASSQREAGFLFMDWLSSVKKAPLPKPVEKFDKDFVDLLISHLLVRDVRTRKSLAQALAHPYIANSSSSNDNMAASQDKLGLASQKSSISQGTDGGAEQVPRTIRNRNQDLSSTVPIHKGTLWKLNANGNPKEAMHWLKRDMWISSNGDLCYFSIKDNKRLVLIETSKLMEARVARFDGGFKEVAFEVRAKSEKFDDKDEVHIFGCDSQEEYETWTTKMKRIRNFDHMQTMQLGANLAQELATFKLKVRNRRMKVEEDSKDQFEPVFKGKLWKVKAEGDRMKEEDWFEREMWLARNGSLVYWSKREDRELIYYTGEDLSRAVVRKIPNGESFHDWTFQVQLPVSDGVEFAPGEFAAESQEMRDEWLAQVQNFRCGARRR